MSVSKHGTTGKITYKLDKKPYLSLVKHTRDAAHRALREYGEPHLSLKELRLEIDRQLQDQSLSEWLVQEREAAR